MTAAISGVLLAAGLSRRFGLQRLKQLEPFRGEALVRRAARQALDSRLREVIVVVGAQGDLVRQALEGLRVKIVDNPSFRDGQSTSVRSGLEAVSPAADGALFLPCDQPFLDGETLDRLLWAYERTGGGIVVPAFQGRRGAPTLFGRRYFPELRALTGDIGGRALLEDHGESVLTVAVDRELPLLDADTPEELARLQELGEPLPLAPLGKPGSLPAGVDHLVLGAPRLQRAVEEWERISGVIPTPGGRHESWGTANALVSLGKETYLEIIAPDPEAAATERPRLFGLHRLRNWALLGWAAAIPDLQDRRGRSLRLGYDPGPVEAMSRRRPDGSELRWHLALQEDLQLRGEGCIPFLIDWQGARHPAAGAAPGCRLTSLAGTHPEPLEVRRILAALDLQLEVREGAPGGLTATLETPAGTLFLDRYGVRPVVV